MPRGVRLTAAVPVLRDRPLVLVRTRLTTARLSIRAAHTVSILRHLDRQPAIVRHRGDQPGNHARLPHTPRMSANDDNCHYFPFANRAKTANCFRYSLIGRAGVPQNNTPFPRTTFPLGTPHCAPKMTPSS